MGQDDLYATSKRQLAYILSRSEPTVNKYLSHGMPGEPGKYPLKGAVAWLEGHLKAQFDRQVEQSGGDPDLIGGGDSPALEKLREAKAELAWMQVERERADLMRRDDVEEGLRSCASILRQCGDTLQRQYGPEARDILDEALADFERKITEEFGESEPPAVATAKSS